MLPRLGDTSRQIYSRLVSRPMRWLVVVTSVVVPLGWQSPELCGRQYLASALSLPTLCWEKGELSECEPRQDEHIPSSSRPPKRQQVWAMESGPCPGPPRLPLSGIPAGPRHAARSSSSDQSATMCPMPLSSNNSFPAHRAEQDHARPRCIIVFDRKASPPTEGLKSQRLCAIIPSPDALRRAKRWSNTATVPLN